MRTPMQHGWPLALVVAQLAGCAGSVTLGADARAGDRSLRFADTSSAVGDGWYGDGIAGDGAAGAALLQAVASAITLPTSSEDFAMDLDGDGQADNRMGASLGTVRAFSPQLDLQAALDEELASGALLLLFDVRGADDATRVQLHLGQDLDSNPLDNLSGTEALGVAPGSPQDVVLSGRIAGAELAASGAALLPLAAGGAAGALRLERARLQATIRDGGLTQGKIGGAAPMTAVQATLIPLIAEQLQKAYADPQSDPLVRQQIGQLFDTNADGKITAAEVGGNTLVLSLLSPDLDLDGDGQKDALSFCAGFTAVGCRIR